MRRLLAFALLSGACSPGHLGGPDAGGPVGIDAFTATPATVFASQPSTLAWTTHGASSCTLDGSAVDVQGSQVVTPTQTRSYRLECAGQPMPASAEVTVTVTATPGDQPQFLTAEPGDGYLTFTWSLPDGGDSNLYFASQAGVTRATYASKPEGMKYAQVTSPFKVTGLVNGRAYFATATAVLAGVETVESNQATGTPRDTTDPDAGDEPFFADQWHLANTGQQGGTAGEDVKAPAAWQTGRGEGVRVAIVDTNVDFAHEDLWQNEATDASYEYLMGGAPPADAEHGTSVAGMVAARDLNGVGLRGVAPRANLVAFDVLENDVSSTEYDAMTREMDRVAVSNNSWGEANDQTGVVTLADPMWLQGVSDGTSLGRGGKGVVYVWAAGNGGDATLGPLDDANYDGQANSRFVIAVAGVGDDGLRAHTSEAGANVMVAAPTRGRGSHGLSTTDVTGALGANDGTGADYSNADYRKGFNGTSGSTPIVSGVVAMMLQANPLLTWRDVRRLLAYSARQNAPGDPGWATNLAGLHVNHQFGFGVPDAAKAVQLAKAFTAGEPSRTFGTLEQSVMTALPDANPAGVSSTLTVTGSGVGHLEFIEVEVTLPHTRAGDLGVELDRGNGPKDELAAPHLCQTDGSGNEVCNPYDQWVFGSVRHLDEPADGSWTLKVWDGRAGETGSFASWKLTFWGRP